MPRAPTLSLSSTYPPGTPPGPPGALVHSWLSGDPPVQPQLLLYEGLVVSASSLLSSRLAPAQALFMLQPDRSSQNASVVSLAPTSPLGYSPVLTLHNPASLA